MPVRTAPGLPPSFDLRRAADLRLTALRAAWHLRQRMLSSNGRSSPSFLFAIATVAVSVVGYAAWSFLRPSAEAASEEIVRQFARTAGREVSAFRREARAISGKRFSDEASRKAALAAIDERAEKAIRRVEQQGDQAREDLAGLDIAIRTQRNRHQRIETREAEAKEMVNGVAEDLKAGLSSHD
jgi:hypothetical protein